MHEATEEDGAEPTSSLNVQTGYLQQLKVTHRARARAAMRWRPRFLKALAMSCSVVFATKAARVSYNTVRTHQRNDPEFAAQVTKAEAEGAELLHDVCWKAAVQGNVEPVYWDGAVVGHIKKFDSRLRIEMLRAHLPAKFKQPGTANVKINAAGGASVLVIGEAERDELVAVRQQALAAIVERKRLALTAPVIEG
ncbi:MAG: hypothetical protein H0W04_09350 [Chthoniobacterales bacterium]|nr:hypothetical protein [Chthoniobacterales bacterium]